jgi:uncharacterized protein
MSIRSPDPADHAAILALNAAHVAELSPLDADGLQRLLTSAFFAAVARPLGAPVGLLIVLDQSASYDSPNFHWFRRRHARFAYIDRIVLAAGARGHGIAARLYREAFIAARRAGYALVCCEVNQWPPNAASDRFHDKLGFKAVGRAELAGRGKTVRYLEAAL